MAETKSSDDVGTPDNLHPYTWAVALALVYAVLAPLWIYFSDQALATLLHDPQLLVTISIYKGLGFVTVTSLLLLLLASWGMSRMSKQYRAVRMHEQEIERLSRLYAALSQINQAIVRTGNRENLMQSFCHVLVKDGGFGMAWLGWHDETTRQLIPHASAGAENECLADLVIDTNDRLEAQGPAGLAFNERRTQVIQDIATSPAQLPMMDEFTRRRFRSLASVPVTYQGKVAGILAVYAKERYFFKQAEIALLEEAVGDLTYALEAFDREQLRQKAEIRAQNEEAFSRMMIESMPGIIYFYDSQGKFLRWNRNLELVSGYTSEEIAQRQPQDFFAPENHPLLLERIQEAFDQGESYLEAPFRARNGKQTPYYFTGRRVQYDGRACLVGVGIDISERQTAALALQESERKYRELVEYANSIIVRWDSSGTILLMNEFGLRFFGYNAEDLIGENVMGTIVPFQESSGRNLEALVAEITADPRAFEQCINENIKRNGERVWISWTNRIVTDASGVIKEILSVGSDITQQRAAEAAIRELNVTLEQKVAARTTELRTALLQAKSADRLKSSFLATMSHELRTPLNSIIGFTGIVQQELAGPLNDEQKKQLGMVRGSARHLLELINDVLDISKIEAGQLQLHPVPFDLRESLERVSESLRPMAQDKGLQFHLDLPDKLPAMHSDQRRIEQITINLLNNAIKFTDEGEIRLVVTLMPNPQETLNQAAPLAIELKVCDTGVGIKSDDLSQLFQPFRQLDNSLARQYEGTGLGLAICRRLAGLLGGSIRAESTPGRGSIFTVQLPLKLPE